MAGARVVCWLNRDEWLQIYRSLYNFDNVELQRKGVDRVQAWKSRSGGKLPLAIESTADLVLAHIDANISSSFTSEKQLSASMALVRFVNGMVDMCQKGVYARSVHSIAEEIGIPDWLVDLRHEATHANLPSQDTLRAGVKVALSWLQKEYWEAQVSSHKDSEVKLCELLEKYHDVSSIRKTKKKNVEKQASKLQSVAEEVTSFVGSNNLWSQLQTLLLNNNFLQQSTDKGGETNTVNQASEPGLYLPESLREIWYPMFKTLDKVLPDFIPSLILEILESNSDNKDICNHLLPWALWLIQSSTKSNPVFSSKLPWLTILEVCLRNPYFLLKEFVDLILDELPSFNGAVKEKIKCLVDIYHRQKLITNSSPKENYKMKSFEQLNIIERQYPVDKTTVDKTMSNDLQHNSGWSLDCSQTQWDLIPFGEVLGCEVQSVDALELSVFENINLKQVISLVPLEDVREIVNECEEEMDEIESEDEFEVNYCSSEISGSLEVDEDMESRMEESEPEIVLY